MLHAAISCFSQLKDENNIVRIPVIFHIIYYERSHPSNPDGRNTDENVSTELLIKELKDLHDDFLLLNKDTSKVLVLYKDRIGNPNVEFILADTVLQKNGEKGIIRVKDRRNKSKLYKRSDIIDHERYLNVYIGNIPGNFLPSATPWTFYDKDAVYLEYKWIGQGYRLLTHEIGHWFGLLHLWGTGTAEGDGKSCSEGDGIDDTPAQIEATELNADCLTCPPPYGAATDKTCIKGTPSNYNNYMDYSGCRAMFTKGQVIKIRTVLINNRPLIYRNGVQAKK